MVAQGEENGAYCAHRQAAMFSATISPRLFCGENGGARRREWCLLRPSAGRNVLRNNIAEAVLRREWWRKAKRMVPIAPIGRPQCSPQQYRRGCFAERMVAQGEENGAYCAHRQAAMFSATISPRLFCGENGGARRREWCLLRPSAGRNV